MNLFCDVGIKNFCFLICELKDKLTLVTFDLIELASPLKIREIIDLLDLIYKNYQIETFYIESQNFKNTKCIRVETAIITYLNLYNYKFKRVQPKKKLTKLSIDSTSYTSRKKGVVNIGEKMLYQDNIVVSEELNTKISALRKKDDFYDCFLMAITELL
jgi:Poxvirus A22 protein.